MVDSCLKIKPAHVNIHVPSMGLTAVCRGHIMFGWSFLNSEPETALLAAAAGTRTFIHFLNHAL